MKVLKTAPVPIEVGEPQRAILFVGGAANRAKMKIKTPCCVCGQNISDGDFVGLMIVGQSNLMAHPKCYDGPITQTRDQENQGRR